jgi:hypothetical protein
MVCRSCGIGPSKNYKSVNKSKIEKVTAKSHPSKGVIDNTKRKTSVPTRSPARTFTTLGE